MVTGGYLERCLPGERSVEAVSGRRIAGRERLVGGFIGRRPRAPGAIAHLFRTSRAHLHLAFAGADGPAVAKRGLGFLGRGSVKSHLVILAVEHPQWRGRAKGCRRRSMTDGSAWAVLSRWRQCFAPTEIFPNLSLVTMGHGRTVRPSASRRLARTSGVLASCSSAPFAACVVPAPDVGIIGSDQHHA